MTKTELMNDLEKPVLRSIRASGCRGMTLGELFWDTSIKTGQRRKSKLAAAVRALEKSFLAIRGAGTRGGSVVWVARN